MGFSMASVTVVVAAMMAGQTSYSGSIRKQEVDQQKEVFKKWWGEELVWKFDDLPANGSVPDFRIPYAGFIYPDNYGGTVAPLSKYDRAFHGGQGKASSYERRDIARHHQTTTYQTGLFGRRTVSYSRVPHWAGHCNGWTAAAIRHAEPKHKVTRNGVVFSPADIKGLLAELYIYSETEFLGGLDYTINPAILHVSLANWVGRKSHPIGMETTPGSEVWNFPVFSYTTSSAKRNNGRGVEVRTRVTYKGDTRGEPDVAPENKRAMNFHYYLHLNDEGDIVGGTFYSDSSQIDMLWVPLRPSQGGQKGNERGNPHLDLNLVMELWRESVDADLRDKWVNIDPLPTEVGVQQAIAADTNAADTTTENVEVASGEAGQ